MELIKRSFIDSVVKDLKILNGTEYEYFCRPIFNLLIGESSIHKGHNLYGKPVSRTADFSTYNFTIVGQCGTDLEYFDVFTNSLEDLLKLKIENTKPIKDILSAINNCPDCNKIFLFANQMAKAGRLTRVNELITAQNFGKDVYVYDAQGIAEFIFDNIENQRLLSDLIGYLPKASEIYLAIAKTNELPMLSSDNAERSEEGSLLENVRSKKVFQVYGISGIGKTRLVLSAAHKLKKDFDSIIWIKHKEGEVIDFNSIKVSGFNQNMNLTHICSTHRTLVLIDNFDGDLPYLKEIFEKFSHKDSRLLVSSINRTLEARNSFLLGEMHEKDAEKILLSHPAISEQSRKNILEKIGGYPLGLQLVLRIIEDEGFTSREIEEFTSQLDGLGREIVPERSKSITEIVIGKYLNRFQKEFCLIAMLDSETISNFALERTLGPQSLRNLAKASLIVRDGLMSFSIHSIVLVAIKGLEADTKICEELKSGICNSIRRENEFKGQNYYNFCTLHHDFLSNLYETVQPESSKKALLYAIVQTTHNSAKKAELINLIDQYNLNENVDVNLLLLIERIELGLTSIDKEKEKEKYKKTASEGVSLLQKRADQGLSANLELLVLHHAAKLTIWAGDDVKAEVMFRNLLERFKDSDQCKLQLARLLLKRDTAKSAELIVNYFESVLQRQGRDVSHSISLAFYQLLARSEFEELRRKYIDERIVNFFSDISTSLHSSFDFPYQVLSALSKHLGYKHPTEFRSLCYSLPAPDNVNNNSKLMAIYADIQVALYRIYKYSTIDGREAIMDSLSAIAEKYYLEANFKDEFSKLKLAKFYIEIGKPNEALALLNGLTKKDAFYFQTRCKVLRCMGEFKDAILSIEEAIRIECSGQSRRNFLSSFLNDKAETLREDHSPEATNILVEAIALVPDWKTKEAWKAKLSAWKSS